MIIVEREGGSGQAETAPWHLKHRPLSWTSTSYFAFSYMIWYFADSHIAARAIRNLVSAELIRHSAQCNLLTPRILGFAGNDSPSFVFPTAIATKGPTGGSGGSGSGRPAVANKPSFLTGGAGPGGHLSAKRGTEDLDFFIGDEAATATAGGGMR